jgi:hypothetical protein
MRIRTIGAGLLAIQLFMAATPATAQGDWLDKGRDLLNSLTGGESAAAPGAGEIADAFRQALRIGTRNVVQQLGTEDGFYKDPAVRIALPKELQKVKQALDVVGMSDMVDDLELKLNRAAETATPKARKLFVSAVSDMTFDDVMTIYRGPDDAATRYFQQKMTPGLRTEMRPIIETSLSEVGAVQSYDRVMGRYKGLPFVPDVKADLSDHVVDKAMDGIFHYVAKEEAAIRQDPARRTTALLKKVFGAE